MYVCVLKVTEFFYFDFSFTVLLYDQKECFTTDDNFYPTFLYNLSPLILWSTTYLLYGPQPLWLHSYIIWVYTERTFPSMTLVSSV